LVGTALLDVGERVEDEAPEEGVDMVRPSISEGGIIRPMRFARQKRERALLDCSLGRRGGQWL
jgi:hypothetical protein